MRDSKRIIELGFIERGTGQHESNTVYDSQGLSPCQSSTQHKNPTKVIIQKNKCRITKSADSKKLKLLGVGNVNKGGKGQFGYTYYEQGLAPTIAAGTHGYCIGHILIKENETDSTRIYGSKGNSTDG